MRQTTHVRTCPEAIAVGDPVGAQSLRINILIVLQFPKMDLAQQPGFHHPLERHPFRIVAAVMAYRERHLVGFAGLNHPVTFPHVAGHHLFDKNVFARLSRGYGRGQVQVVRKEYIHCIDIALGQ